GGDADERCGAAVETGGETDDVHEDAPADGDDGFTAAVDAEVVECLGEPQHGVHRLVRLAVVQHEQAVVDGVVIEVGADPLTVQVCDDPVGDDEAAPGPGAGSSLQNHRVRRVKQGVAGLDLVRHRIAGRHRPAGDRAAHAEEAVVGRGGRGSLLRQTSASGEEPRSGCSAHPVGAV